ncbi:MAG: pyridoxal 5'-phosphate synthase glutaminase subunit PdxT [Thermoanaerobaculia bacterium]
MDGKKVGVLALQGDFSLHIKMLNTLGIESKEVKKIEDLKELTHLIIPGGESTTLLNFFQKENWFEPLKDFSRKNKVMGTCAGAILLAEEVENPQQESLKVIPMKIRRNGYGRQVDSFIKKIEKHSFGEKPIEGVFIRAPRIISIKEGVKVLAEINGEPVAVEYKNALALTFHPEVSEEEAVYKYFLRI